MIKDYLIIYSVEKRVKVYAGNPYRPCLETTVQEINIPAMNIVEAINYAINKLNIPYQDIKEVFEL